MTSSSQGIAYTYKTFSDPSTQIRLLDLLPGPGPSRVKCCLRNVNLIGSEHSYEPLSYCWGSQKHQDVALVDGARFPIGKNLSGALKRLRDGQRVRTLWVDAICINQTDIPEKNGQIPLMRQIYEGGRQTIVWLGSGRNNTELAFRVVSNLAKDLERCRAEAEGGNGHDRPSQGREEDPANEYNTLQRWRQNWNSYFADRALKDLLSCAWFTRVWVIQEVAVSSSVTIHWGEFSTSWNTIEDAYPFFPRVHDKMGNVENLILQRIAYQHSKRSENLAFNAYLASSAQATDPRDKIYALLGLADNSDWVSVDYGTSAANLYLNFTRSHLERYKDPGILAHSIGCSQQGSERMSSWTFKPASGSGDRLYHGLYAWDVKGPYQRLNPPQFQSSGSSSFSPVFEGNGKVLGLRGYQIDTIVSAAVAMELSDSYMSPVMDNLEASEAITYLRWRSMAGLDVDAAASYRDSTQSISEVLFSIIHSSHNNISENEYRAKLKCADFIEKNFRSISRIPPRFRQLTRLYAMLKIRSLNLGRDFWGQNTRIQGYWYFFTLRE